MSSLILSVYFRVFSFVFFVPSCSCVLDCLYANWVVFFGGVLEVVSEVLALWLCGWFRVRGVADLYSLGFVCAVVFLIGFCHG